VGSQNLVVTFQIIDARAGTKTDTNGSVTTRML
jgi:hypothetical protein